MRVAIIGYPGAGKSTAAAVLAARFGTRPIASLAELPDDITTMTPIVLDGVPETLAELTELDAVLPDVDRFLYLDASPEVRVRRVARMVVAGLDTAAARGRMLHPPTLGGLRSHLDAAGRLTTISAYGSRTDVLTRVFNVLGIAA